MEGSDLISNLTTIPKMGEKKKIMEDEISRFEAEVLKPSTHCHMFVPNQVRPVIAASTYSQVQQKLEHNGSSLSVPPPPIPPAFMSTFVPTSAEKSTTIKSLASTATPIVLSCAPKLYQSRQSVHPPSITSNHHIDINTVQFDVTQKLKKLKAEKSGPNPIAEEAIKAAKASSALQSFQAIERKKKDRKTVRIAGGQTWEDQSLSDWPDDDFRIFCGDLGNDVNDEVLTRTFNRFTSFQKARVIRDKRTGKSKGFGFVSFKEPADFIRAMKEMDGRYVGSRPIKLRKSTWKQRSLDVVRKKEKEKQALLQSFCK